MKRSADATPLTDRLVALSDPLRLRICRLVERQELTVGEISKAVQLPQSTVSRHLKLLSEAGWLARRSEGTAALYRLIPDDLDPSARTLWSTIREELDDDTSISDDARRLRSVLAERRTDSLAFFGRVAGEWDQVRNELFGSSFSEHAMLALLPGSWTVADIGCGTGNAAEMLAPHVREVVAIDQSEPMLAAARKRLSSFDNVRFVHGPIEAIPLDDASVDAAVCLMVLHHVPEPVEALREMRRIIRPGGVCLVVDMFAHKRTEYRHTMGHKHLGFAPDQIITAMTEAGFDKPRLVALPTDSRAKGPGTFALTGLARPSNGTSNHPND